MRGKGERIERGFKRTDLPAGFAEEARKSRWGGCKKPLRRKQPTAQRSHPCYPCYCLRPSPNRNHIIALSQSTIITTYTHLHMRLNKRQTQQTQQANHRLHHQLMPPLMSTRHSSSSSRCCPCPSQKAARQQPWWWRPLGG